MPAERRTRIRSKDEIPAVIFIDPGKSSRLQLTVSNYANDALGTLQTGEVEFAVESPGSQDVTVDFDPETGVVTLKGSKDKVERTATVLEAIRNAQPAGGLPGPLDAPQRNFIPLSNMNGKAAVENLSELCIILGIEEPQLVALDGAPRSVYFAPGEVFHNEVTDWVKLLDVSNSKNTEETEDAEAQNELASLRRRVLDHLSAQAEFRLTQLILDHLVSNEQSAAKENDGQSNASELAEETMAVLRQKASDKLNELRSAAQKAALDSDLQEQLEPEKSEIVVTPYPLKSVSSQKAESIILNASRMFGILPETPASDIRTNVLIIVKNGRQKYFTCLATTIDRSAWEHAMTFDERIELWKNRLQLLAMLKIAVENSLTRKKIDG